MATAEGRFLERPGVVSWPVRRIWHAAIGKRWVIGMGAVFTLLRLPSFVEPTWYSDSGTYADIGWALSHGARLYIDVWDNKPPGIYWLSEFLVGHLPLGLAMPLAASTFTAAAALCVAAVGNRLGGAQVGAAAALLYVVVASLPSLDGNLFNAELCGATCIVVAIAIALRSESIGWLIAAGALAGVAMLFKGVFAADLVAVMGIPAIVTVARRRRSAVVAAVGAASAVLAGATLVLIAAAVALLRQGALDSAINVITRSDVGYIATYGSGGIGGVQGALLTALRISLVISAGFGLTAILLRTGRVSAGILVWWLGLDLASSMVSGRGFPHYVQQAEPALCLSLALAAVTLSGRIGHRRLLTAAALPAVLLICQAVVWIPSAEVALATGHAIPGPRYDGVATDRLPAYYFDGYRRLVDPSAASIFDGSFPTDLTNQRLAVDIVDSHSAPGDRVFVWGSIPWIYALSNRMPAGRYVALNAAYYIDPSAQSTLVSDLEAHPPAVLIVETRPIPGVLLDFINRHAYRRVGAGAGGYESWVRVTHP